MNYNRVKAYQTHQSGVMNGTERAYALRLELLKRIGEIQQYYFESFTLKLAQDTRYTPDFMVINKDWEIEYHECKGSYIRDDALVKIKVAASMFPFKFYMCKYIKRQWEIKDFTVK